MSLRRMSLIRFFKRNRNAEADRSSLVGTITGRDSVRLPETQSMYTLEASQVETPIYIYYRIYAEDGAIPSNTPVTPGDPFLGRIKAISVPPPHTAKGVKYSIAKVENITNRTDTSLFLTPHAQSPMDDVKKVTIFDGTGLGSTPREPLALVVKMSDSERSALESERRGEPASAEESDITHPETQLEYLYYLLYADGYEVPSKVAIDPEKPSLGRIRADSVAPPHSPASIKRCISRVERSPTIADADLYADISCHAPLKEGHISILPDGPGLSPNKPMAIVQMPVVQMKTPSIPDGKYLIKNRAAGVYWSTGYLPFRTVHLWSNEMKLSSPVHIQWNITHDNNGNIFMTSPFASSLSIGAGFNASTVPVPWRLIPADGDYYYLTTDMNPDSLNPQVSAAYLGMHQITPGVMTTLKEGDIQQMWEFIRCKR